MVDAARRRNGLPSAFGGLLRHWRTSRRLSQLELALATDVSQRHVSFLESGRARPSRGMVMRLSEALCVPIRERNALLHAAGFSAAFGRSDLSAPAMTPVREALRFMLDHHEPYPAIVVDREWNLVMTNQGLPRLFGLVGDLEQAVAATCGDRPANVYRLTFHPAGLRPYIANWSQVAPHLLQRLMRQATDTGSEASHALLEELLGDGSLPRHWGGPAFDEPLEPVLSLELAVAGHALRLFSVISTFGTPQDVTTDELRVESFFPADETTAAVLRRLARPSSGGLAG